MALAGVAVLVVNYGSSGLLVENLLPLSRSAPELTVVVVDNLTTDAERTRVRGLAAAEGWLLVLPDTNTGFGRGMNIAAARARAEGAVSVLLLNPDARIEAVSVAGLVERARIEPRTMVAPRILRPDGSVWFEGSDLYLDDGRIRSRRRRPEGSPRVEEWLTGACLLLSTELYQRAGGFDEDYFLYWEDVDFSRRVRDAGGSLRVLSEVTAVHAEGGTQASAGLASSGQTKSAVYYRYNIRNRMLFAAKHLGDDDLEKWNRTALRVSWEILLQGGRKQFLRSPGLLGIWFRAVREARGIARDEQRRRRA
jgi:GT2 family glycosyltransferase